MEVKWRVTLTNAQKFSLTELLQEILDVANKNYYDAPAYPNTIQRLIDAVKKSEETE